MFYYGPDYRVVCRIRVENWTRFTLKYPVTRIEGGRLYTSPVEILPGYREEFIAHKTPITATGSYGTVSWYIANNNRRVVVMWDCPFSFDFHSNVLSVGLTYKGVTYHSYRWYDRMYSSMYDGDGLSFARRPYEYSTEEVVSWDSDFKVTGTMGTHHRTTARIIIKPRRSWNLAYSMRDYKSYL